MLGRGRINGPDRGGSVLSHAAGALEERLVWSGGERLRAAGDALRWPVERIGWAVERRLLWPLQERTATWRTPPRAIGLALLAALAVAVGVGALLLAAPGGNSASRSALATPAASAPSPAPTTAPAPALASPTLHGAAPVFKAKSDVSGGVAAAGHAEATLSAVDAAKAGSKAGSAPAKQLPPRQAGPAAIAVAHRFSSAFVLYETGRTTAQVRSVFHETATPELARQLLRRPPRLPANVDVPQARVVNVVPGPCLSGECTVSVSLLRVGVTSELRISVAKEKSGDQRVANVLG